MKALILVLTFFCFIFAFSQLGQGTRTLVAQPQMKMNESSTLNQTQQYNHIKRVRTCSYLVDIYTRCDSPYDANDKIYIVFGDADGRQVYDTLKNVGGGKFKPCMINGFRIEGECMNKICKLLLQREGSDGWIAEKVTISDFNYSPVTFYYNKLIPNDWQGHGSDFCEEEL